MDTIMIRNFSLPIAWLAFFIAVFFIERRAKNADAPLKWAVGTLPWVYIVVWKFSYIAFSFQAFMKAPISVIYFDGGLQGHIAATVVIMSILMIRRSQINIEQVWVMFIEWIVVFQVVSALTKLEWLSIFIWMMLGVLVWKVKHQWLIILVFIALVYEYTFMNSIVLFYSSLFVLLMMKVNTIQRKQLFSYAFVAVLVSFLIPTMTKVETATHAAENIALYTIEGERMSMTDEAKKHQLTVFNFFATWCPPCKAEMPHLQSFASHLPEDVQLIGVNLTKIDDGEKALNHFMVKYGVTYPILLDAEGEADDRYEVATIPTTVVLNRDGQEVYRHVGAISEQQLLKVVSRYKE